MAKTARKDRIEIITGIKAGYVITFNSKKKTIRFFKNDKLEQLYFDQNPPDNQARVGFIKDAMDFAEYVLTLANINNLQPKEFKLPSGDPAWIFCEKKAGNVRGCTESVLDAI